MEKRTIRTRMLSALVAFVFLLVGSLPNGVPVSGESSGNTEPEKWYYGSDLTIDRHIIFGEDKMYMDGRPNRGFTYLLDNNTANPFYVTTNDTAVNYQDLTQNGKEISVTFHTSSPVIIDHFKIISGADTYNANYAHRSPTKWNLKAGNGPDSCDTVLSENLPVKATKKFEENAYEFENTTPYQYYKFTVTALAGAGKKAHDWPNSNQTATCLLADILIGGPEPVLHTDHDDIAFQLWNSTNSLPNTAGNYALISDVTISSTWNVPSGTTNLCLNGHSITRTGASGTTGSVIQVGNGATLNLHDCGTQTRYYTVSNPTANGAGLGTVVEKSVYDAASENARGTFTGGYITGGVISGAADANHLIGGGVNVAGGAFHMYGGTIIGNKVCINGGGVKVKGAGASFIMNGGAILANYNDCYGGGISVGDNGANRLCTVAINGGTIARNWSGRNGGALHFDGYKHTFTITGGSIVNNYTNGNYENGSTGRAGGGIIKDGTPLVMSGNPVIKDNMNGGNQPNNAYMRSDKTDVITLSGLTDGSDVSVYIKGITASNDIKIATGAQKTDIQYLHYDIPNEAGILYCDGETDWIYADGTFAKLVGAHHTHAAGTVWATVSPAAAVTDGATATVYAGFGAALNAWKNGGTLTLLKDATFNEIINMRPMYGYGASEYVLDLNGNTFHIKSIQVGLNNSPNTLRTGPHLTIQDSGTGGILHFSESGMIDYGGLVELRGGTLTGGNGTWGGLFLLHIYASLDMYDGVTLTGNTSTYGGAVLVGSDSVFNMYGGKITGNSASDSGGGVVIFDNDAAKFNLYGGEISGNRAPKGGGVSVNIGQFSICGSGAVIRDNVSDGSLNNETGTYTGGASSNVYLPSGKTIKVTAALSSTPVGVTLQNGEGVITSGLSDYGTEESFISDNDSFQVFLNDDGEAEIGIPPVASVISGETTTNYGYFSDALSAWTASSTLKLLADVTVGSAITVPSGTHTLDLNGYGIRMTGNGPAIRLNAGYTLHICDTDPTKEHYVTLSNYRGTAVSDTGTETEVTGGSGVVKVTGGYITGGNNGSGGGGIYSGNTSNSGNLYITGVTFIGNKANGASSYGQGSAICAYTGGTLDLDGTKFFYNFAQRDGGGNANTVCRWGGTTSYNNVEARFNMGGGISVPANTPVSGKTVIRDNIRSSANPTEFNSSVGTFDGSGLTEGSYIGIRNKSNRRLTTGNDAANYLQYCHLDPSITDYGIALDGEGYGIVGQLHTITYENNGGTGTVTDSDSPYVHGESVTVSDNGFTQPAGYEFDHWNTADDGNGVSYDPEDEMVLTEDVVLYAIWRPHVHEWTYSATGNTITATCKGEQSGVCNLGSQTLTITAGGKVYDGQPVAASVTASDGWTKENGLADIPTIVYSGNTDAGTYSASITVDEKTATASFTISQKSMADEISAVGFSGNYDGKSHKITVTVPDGATVKFGTTSGAYSLTESPVYTNAGDYTVYYQVTKKNYVTVTGSATVNISPLNVTVTIIGNNTAVDYDGKAHSIVGYTATANSDLYDVTKDIAFGNVAIASSTDAGTVYMNLNASQFANINPNFKTVTFLVTDGYIEVKPIGVVVTIVGNNGTVDYDGTEHTVTGYTATTQNDLYDVTKDFTFSGNATVSGMDAGTYPMNLTAEQFVNTNSNFTGVTFNITDGYLTVSPINATVTIVGNNDTAEYDGEKHTVIGYTAATDCDLYDVEKDVAFGNVAIASSTDAGTVYMNLDADQFANTNPNFKTVTFLVTDGYITVKPINATVTITGNNDTVDYDGQQHTVVGYTAQADTELYDVTKDFAFGNVAIASSTDAGTVYMNLDASQFANTNPNFKTVTFLIKDGYLTVVPVDSLITKAPAPTKPVYNGSKQKLVTAGVVDGGTLYYALGDDPQKAPKDKEYSTTIPSAKEIGSYYIWYKVKSDANHNDLPAAYLKVTLADKGWVTLTGTLYESDGKTPLSGAVVTLVQGEDEIDYVITDETGNYLFTVPTGIYNLVADHQKITETTMVKLFDDTKQSFTMLGGKTESLIEVNDNGDSGFAVMVDGLNAEALAIRKEDNIANSTSVSVVMKVEAKTQETAKNATVFAPLSVNKSLMFFDIQVEKAIDSNKTVLDTTKTVLEIAVPYEKIQRRGLAVYYSDGTALQTFEESDSKQEGTFYIDKENGFIYIYSNRFATFAIGYTPYYAVRNAVSLGSFKGEVTVVLKDENGNSVYELENVTLDNADFADVPKGEYTMTITWKDGVTNTLTMPLAVS